MEVSPPRAPAIPPRRCMENVSPTPLHTSHNITPPPRFSSQNITPPARRNTQRDTQPARRHTQSVTPPARQSTHSVTPPARRLTQSVTPPAHRDTHSVTPPPGRGTLNEIPPSRRNTHNTTPPLGGNTENGAPPPVPTRWDLCTEHVGHKYTALCTTCVKFLCNKCLVSEIYYHQQCSVAYLSEDAQHSCRCLKESLCEKLANVSETLTNFQTSLCKKRDRMLKKRNETITEIKHYYNMLRELLLSKLHRDEDELLNMMKGKVDDQDTVILEKIQQCCATTGYVQEKRAMIKNSEQLYSGNRSSGNKFEYVKNLVNTSHFLKECEQVEKDVAAVRDGFLLIRFFVNSETEQTILNSNVACVEVLHSWSDNIDGESLESERICEAAQAISREANDVLDVESIDSVNATGALRVVLPPVNEQNLENAKEQSSGPNDISVSSPLSDVSTEQVEQEASIQTADQISDLINEFDIGLGNRSENTDEDSPENVLSNEMILSNIQIGSPSEIVTELETEADRSNEFDSHTAVSEREQTPAAAPDNEAANSETSVADRRQSVAVTISSDSNCIEQGGPRDDDPPPPYPGLTSAPDPPGPDELPPPYPGTGPPPPYSQNQIPEAQQPSNRRRLNVEPGHRDRIPRHSSDSDFQSGQRDIAAPTQRNTPRLSRPKVSNAFSVNESNDKRVSGLFAVASVRDCAFLIVDRWNKKLKYFSDSGVSFGGLIFREEPWDITSMADDLVAVTVPKLQIFYKIKVTNNSVITMNTVPTQRSYSSIAFNKVTHLFICGQVPQFGEAVVDIIGIDGGQIIQTFRTGFNSELRFSYPRYVKVNEEGIVIVCDWNLKCLLLFKLDGSVVGRYRGTVEFPLNEPTGITYNHATKEIYVIDVKHTSTLGAIHIVSLNCRCKEIVRWDNEFRAARAITPHGSGYALGSKSGVMNVFKSRERR